jgi:hypothetical protein
MPMTRAKVWRPAAGLGSSLAIVALIALDRSLAVIALGIAVSFAMMEGVRRFEMKRQKAPAPRTP